MSLAVRGRARVQVELDLDARRVSCSSGVWPQISGMSSLFPWKYTLTSCRKAKSHVHWRSVAVHNKWYYPFQLDLFDTLPTTHLTTSTRSCPSSSKKESLTDTTTDDTTLTITTTLVTVEVAATSVSRVCTALSASAAPQASPSSSSSLRSSYTFLSHSPSQSSNKYTSFS